MPTCQHQAGSSGLGWVGLGSWLWLDLLAVFFLGGAGAKGLGWVGQDLILVGWVGWFLLLGVMYRYSSWVLWPLASCKLQEMLFPVLYFLDYYCTVPGRLVQVQYV